LIRGWKGVTGANGAEGEVGVRSKRADTLWIEQMVGTLRHSETSIVPAADHVDRVYATAEGRESPAADDEVSISWQRCVNTHGVDPASKEPPRILTRGELKNFREPLEKLVVDAQDELDRLYNVVRRAGYVILLCDSNGVVVDHRGNQAEAEQFAYRGIWLGGVWSEEVEGTNGIGTCIAEERPVTVHQSQHFRARHISLSCSGAPIFDGDGNLAAILDVSSLDPELSEQSHALTGALTEASARAIQERAFRERFRREWVVAVAQPDGAAAAMLIAVDQHQRIVGADRIARMMLLRNSHSLEKGVSLWNVFERDDVLFRHKDHGDVPTRLVPAGTDELWPALISPPESVSAVRRNLASASLHSRPRSDLIASFSQSILPHPARGGLPPRALRRVQEYIEAHLEENIALEALAAAAGLSMFHFARAFKQSEGVTPHSYLVQRRIERAQELLTVTDCSLSDIALATGFSDQSHLARHFRERVGMPPSAFRWSKR
jgi:AraC-like DNA-binding protein